MRTTLWHDADIAFRAPVGDKALPEEFELEYSPRLSELRRWADRVPVLSEKLSCWRVRTHPRETLVLALGKHGALNLVGDGKRCTDGGTKITAASQPCGGVRGSQDGV